MWAGTHHNGAVNCVRWSPCGNYLATCSDDNTVAVLRYAGKFDYVPLGQKEANPETWEVHKQYQGHEKDVLHVAWNQSGSMLASSGVDNLIFVWTLESLAPVRRLQASGMVKGVAWDPIGKYLAAQVTGGEEKSANLWRLRDWQVSPWEHPKPRAHRPSPPAPCVFPSGPRGARSRARAGVRRLGRGAAALVC
jgi:protein HIRA/HIR1